MQATSTDITGVEANLDARGNPCRCRLFYVLSVPRERGGAKNAKSKWGIGGNEGTF